MIEDGELPSSNPQMTDFDFDWEREWTVEISKTAFATAFGDTAFPKNMDFLYIPMMKRMYAVNSAYDEKKDKLMWRSTTWTLMLQKYNSHTSVETEEFTDIIDSFIVNNYQDVFGNIETVEQERTSGVTQADSPKFAATNIKNVCLQDAVRAYVDTIEINNIKAEQLNHASNVVVRNIYNFKTILPDEGWITYQNQFCGDSGTISLVLQTKAQIRPFSATLVKIDNIILELSKSPEKGLELTSMGVSVPLEENKTYLIVLIWNRKNWSVSLAAYEHKLQDEDVPYWMRRPDLYRFDFENPISAVGNYPGELVSLPNKTHVMLHPVYCGLSNFKLYERALDAKHSIEESIKYTTTNKDCVINDLARPLEGPQGFEVR